MASLKCVTLCVAWVVCLVFTVNAKKFTEEDCEVCVNVLNKFSEQGPKNLREKSSVEIEEAFKKFCKGLKGSDERFCYYIGGAATSATYILPVMSKPFKHHVPTLKICEKLKDADPQICDLKYEKQMDWSTVDFKKLKVKDLKKILADWKEEDKCKGCSEKSEFLRAVKELMPKHAPEAYQKLKDRDEF